MGKGRRPCCDKATVKTGPWSQAEDFKLVSFIQKHGHDNWRALPKLAGLPRCGKSCRLRWVNYLRPDLKRGNFTPHEEEAIIKLHQELGNKWSKIASKFPGRTDNEIKNVWNTHLKKRTQGQDKDCKSQESCKSEPASTSIDEALDVSCKDDCSEHSLIPQTITMDDTTEHSSSSSTSHYSSQPPFSGPEMKDLDLIFDDLGTPSSNMVESSTLEGLIEVPFEPNLDLWELLDGDQSSSGDITDVHFCEVDTPLQLATDNDDKSIRSNTNDTSEGGSNWWLVYLENELGLDHTETVQMSAVKLGDVVMTGVQTPSSHVENI